MSGAIPAPVLDAMRAYDSHELGGDGYPPAWHRLPGEQEGIKHAVLAQAGHRCVRCGHPYRNGEHGSGEWSPCDERCTHGAPLRVFHGPTKGQALVQECEPEDPALIEHLRTLGQVEARWRSVTVHHLDGDKANCRWWNLAALCQRCHLTIQHKVRMERTWPCEHSAWFRPYVAGFYAWSHLRQDLTRAEVEARLDELLALAAITTTREDGA